MYLSKISWMLLKETEVAFQIRQYSVEGKVCTGQASFSSIYILVNVKREQSETRVVTILVNCRDTEPSVFRSLTHTKQQQGTCYAVSPSH